MATITATAKTVDVRPPMVKMRGYAGNPFALTVLLRVDGQPADIPDWVWTASVRIAAEVIPFQTLNLPDGVQISMSGADMERVAVDSRFWRFELYGRNPLASEGYTILYGHLQAEKKLPLPPAPPQRGVTP
jgi:hypothetical protein